MVRDALEAPQGPLGATGQGVFVADFANAAAMDFDVVWMVGMIEGRVPPATPPRPIAARIDPRQPEPGFPFAAAYCRRAVQLPLCGVHGLQADAVVPAGRLGIATAGASLAVVPGTGLRIEREPSQQQRLARSVGPSVVHPDTVGGGCGKGVGRLPVGRHAGFQPKPPYPVEGRGKKTLAPPTGDPGYSGSSQTPWSGPPFPSVYGF